MKLVGKTIKIYVRGNTPKSLKSIEIINWSGKAFMGHRNHLKQLKEIPELSETGIYFLLSNNDESGLTEIYIGETDSSSQRINQHVNKPWWDTFIVFVSRDLTKAHVRYLESKLYNLAKKSVSSLKVMNDGYPGGSKLSESEACSMEEFADNMIFMLESLGLGLFQSDSENTDESEENKIERNSPKVFPKNYEATEGMTFQISLPKDIASSNEKAIMTVKNESFILKTGSMIRKNAAGESFEGSSYNELWKQIISSDAVKKAENSELLVTVRDLEFKSPSAAAAIVRARATNGRTEWKRISDNKSLFECELED